MLTRQTVSIAGVKGGVALDADEAAVLADLLEWVARHPFSDTAQSFRARERIGRIINVLRGEEPGGEEPGGEKE